MSTEGCLLAALQQQLDTESTRRQQSDALNQENQVKVQEFQEFKLQHVRIKSQLQVTHPSLCSCLVLSRSFLSSSQISCLALHLTFSQSLCLSHQVRGLSHNYVLYTT